MTYEDLIVAIDHAAPKLSEASLRLLLRLVSLAIHRCSCEVKVSHGALAEQLNMSREGVARGMRGLSHLVDTEGRNGIATTFVLPAEWFAPHVRGREYNTYPPGGSPLPAHDFNRPTSQAGTCQLPRQVPAYELGRTGLRTRQDLPTSQAAPAYEPGRSGLPSWPVGTENQQLGDAPLIRSDQDLNQGTDSLINQISAVANVEKLRDDQKEVAALLSLDLVRYVQIHHPQGGVEEYPSERILARCLAIADYEALAETLTTLHKENRTAGKKFAWFVAVFLNRIHRIDSQLVEETFEAVRLKKKGLPQQTPLFGRDLVEDTAAKIRRLA